MRHGFTLIELLIVIALLGALAIGLLATIDPFEQLKKGRDTSTRNTTLEAYNSELRYYSTKAAFTWPTSSSFVAQPLSSMGSDITTLISAGELKNQFIQLAGTGNLAKIFLSTTSSTNVSVCFKPESKSFQIDPATIFGSDGQTSASVCKSQTSVGGTDCFYCVQ